MSTSRPKLKLDEQSFQDMLAAAFTIQEHNAKRKRPSPPEHFCGTCNAPVREGELLCGQCAAEDLRPGEEMQRKWASLWLMSQEQGLFPEHKVEEPEIIPDEIAVSRIHDVPETLDVEIEVEPSALETDTADEELPIAEEELAHAEEDPPKNDWPSSTLDDLRSLVAPLRIVPEVEASLENAVEEVAVPPRWSLGDLRLKLRFHRADLYLVVAIVVATFAMVWVLSATPAPGAQRKPRLRPWERALISMGLAEAPEAPPQRGNPNIQVWEDPKTALYYCVGEELYGKTPGGRATTQGEAQLDQFEPASRAACE